MTELTLNDLNKGQRTAYEGIVELFNQDGPKVAILTGPAGTGKTAVLKFLHKELDAELSAMTHKAAAVMCKATGFNVKTLAKVLKQQKYNDTEAGVVRFKTRDTVSLSKDTLFVDESSMMNEENFAQVMQAIADEHNILFIGDEFQLPPVNEDYSKALINDIPTFKLTQIMRSKDGSGIQVVSNKIREALENREDSIGVQWDEFLASYGDVEWIKEGEAFPRMVEDFKNAEDVDDVRMISFTNARVEQFNYHLKQQVTGDAERFKEGDILMANAAYGPKFQVIEDGDSGDLRYDVTKRIDGVVLQNNEGIRVTNVREGTLMGIKVWIIDCDECRNIPVAQDRFEWERIIKDLGKRARLHANGTQERRDTFTQMFDYIEAFADLRLNYAQTVHKSQGSTYKTCYFDLTSLNSATEMGKKLLYTGVTRASEKLVLFR